MKRKRDQVIRFCHRLSEAKDHQSVDEILRFAQDVIDSGNLPHASGMGIASYREQWKMTGCPQSYQSHGEHPSEFCPWPPLKRIALSMRDIAPFGGDGNPDCGAP